MDGLDGTGQPQPRAQFLEGKIGLVPEGGPQRAPVGGQDDGLAAAVAVARGDVSGVAPLLEEFLDHAKGNLEAEGDLIPGRIATIVGPENPMSKVQ